MTQLEFFTALANGAKWGVPATISRSGSANGGLPIDAYSIFDSKAKAELYASQDKTAVEAAGMVNNAYVGQIITVWEKLPVKDAEGNPQLDENDAPITVDDVSVYYIDADKTLKPVGIVPSGDGATIEVTAAGAISLAGFANANSGYLPRKAENGTLEWVPISAVVQGDGNSVTTVTAKDNSVTVTDTAAEGFEGHKYEVKVNVSAEANNKVELKNDGLFVADTDLSNYYDKAHVDGIDDRVDAIERDYLKTADKYDDTALAARVKILEDEERYDETPLANRVSSIETAINGGTLDGETVAGLESRVAAMETFWDATEDTDDIVNKLKEIQDYIASDETGATTMAGNIKTNTDAITKLNGNATVEGSVDKKIADAIIPLATKEYTDAELAKKVDKTVYETDKATFAIAETVNSALDLKANVADVVANNTFESFKTTNDQAIAAARTNAVSDVAAVGYALANEVVSKAVFDTFKDDNTAAISTAKQEAIAAAASAEEAKGYAVASIVADTYATKGALTDYIALAEDKYATKQFVGTIPTGYTESTVIAYVNKKAQEVLEAATGGSTESAASVKLQLDNYKSANDPKVTALLNEVYGPIPEGKDAHDYTAASRIDTNAQNILAMGQTISDLGLIIDGDGGIVSQVGAITTDISTRIDVKLQTLEGTTNTQTTNISKNTADILTLNTVTIPALSEAIDNTNKKIGAVPDGKTIVGMIDDIPSKIDFTPYAKATDVEAIYKAAEGENAATGLLANAIVQIETLVGTDANKSVRAIAAEETAKIVAGADAKYDTLKEIADFITSDTAGAAKMASDIAELQEAVGKIVTPKASAEVTVATDGTLGIGQVSTDKLVQGANTLILNGGNASV